MRKPSGGGTLAACGLLLAGERLVHIAAFRADLARQHALIVEPECSLGFIDDHLGNHKR
jgi:hypothetical protein